VGQKPRNLRGLGGQWAKCSKYAFRGPFWPYLGQCWQNAQNISSEAHSGYMWVKVAKMLKIGPLRPILAISGPRQPKCSKYPFRGTFWLHLGQGCNNIKNRHHSETNSGHIWAKAAKIHQKGLPRPILAISRPTLPKSMLKIKLLRPILVISEPRLLKCSK